MTKTKYIIIVLAALGLVATPFLSIKAQDTATVEKAEPLIDETAADTTEETPTEPASIDEALDDPAPAAEETPVEPDAVVGDAVVGEEEVSITPEDTTIEPVGNEKVIEEIEEPISAGEATDDQAAEEKLEQVFEDENITFEDLEINDQTLLPTSPYYPIKNIWRGFRATFTFDPVQKAKLKLRFADERLLEAKKVAQTKDSPEVVTKALERYEKEFSSVSDLLKRAPEERREEVKQFADKIIDHSFKQQRLIDGIEKRLEPEHFEKINKVREDGIKHFSQVITNMTPPEEIKDKITNVIENQRGSDFKHFKNLEILKAIEEKVPEAARDAIRQAQENAIKRLNETMEAASVEKRQRFKEYVEDVGGNEARHLEIINDFTTREIPEIIREEMKYAKERAFGKIEEKIKKFERKEQKQEYLKHLEGGKMEDLRIIKELENNLSPETIDNVLEIKNKAMDNFRRGFEVATTEEEQDEFFEEMGEFHDVKQFEVFSEIEKIIPEDKKEFFEKMKIKAMEEMRRDVDMARDDRHREEIFERLAGDTPEHFEIISEFAPPPEIMEGILRHQADKLQDRIDIIKDPSKLDFFEKRIEDEEFLREELEKRVPDFFRHLEKKSEMTRSEVKKEEALHKLETAREELKHTKKYLSELKTNEEIMKHLNQTPVDVHLENAVKHINEAEEALDRENYRHMFGAANAALHELRNVGKIIKDSELRAEITEERIEKMEKMMDLREEMIGEFEVFDKEIFNTTELREEKMEKIIEGKMDEGREKDQEFEVWEKELLRKEKRNMMESIFQEQTKPEEQEFKFKFKQEFFPEEERGELDKVIEQLPAHIQGQLQNLPPDMIPQALDRLKIKIEHREERPQPQPEPLPAIEDSEKALPPGLLGPPIKKEPTFFEKPLETIRKDIPETIKRRLRIEKEKESVVCIQVITPAKNPKTGECKYFPTPCDVPDHWEKVETCKNILPTTGTKTIRIEGDTFRSEFEKQQPTIEPVPLPPREIKPLYEEPIPVYEGHSTTDYPLPTEVKPTPEEPTQELIYPLPETDYPSPTEVKPTPEEPTQEPIYEKPIPLPIIVPKPEEPVYDEPVPTPTSGGGGGGSFSPSSSGGLFDRIKN